MRVFTSALFVTVPNRRLLKCPFAVKSTTTSIVMLVKCYRAVKVNIITDEQKKTDIGLHTV